MINTEDINTLMQNADAQQVMRVSEFNNTVCYNLLVSLTYFCSSLMPTFQSMMYSLV